MYIVVCVPKWFEFVFVIILEFHVFKSIIS